MQPGTAGPGNSLGCCLISFHFLWAILCPQAVFSYEIIVDLVFSSFRSEDFPEENTDCQYAANFLDHKSVNMNEILCLDVGGDKYREDEDDDG